MIRLVPIFLLLMTESACGLAIITYPYQRIEDAYPVKLLELALSKSNDSQNYALRESKLQISQGRSLILLSQNREVDVAWSLTSNAREQILRPVKIPIYKGLYGYRIFVIKKSNQNLFPTGLTRYDLANERIAIQGVDWPDLAVLQHNRFTVISVEQFNAMYELVEKGRADYFPRSIIEIWNEEHSFKTRGLMIEQNLAFSYPAFMFFFVSKENQQLANIIRSGLLTSIEDGSFEQLFHSYKGDVIGKARLGGRAVYPLENPNVNNEGVYQWPSFVE